ncbi:MAG: YihY/virulence factor BrkB family protein [Nostocaceae cyanobacterium]|nr:YihY/virulence factor BrkB family protein [Nostocaceae cyanobacterium]
MFSSRFFRFFRHLNCKLLKHVIQEIGRRRLPGLASEMAYNNLLAIFPGILAVLTLIGGFNVSRERVGFLIQQVSTMVPQDALNLIRGFADNVELPQGQGLFSLSFGLALWVASSALSAAMNAMDEIYRIPPGQRRPFWKAKLVSLLLTLGSIILVLTASFLVFISDFILNFVLQKLETIHNEMETVSSNILYIWNLFRWPAAFVILSLSFSFIYRYGPSKWEKGTPLMPGAIFAALLWAMISKIFRLYVTNFANYDVTYGTLGAGIILLLWLNLTSLAILIGVQLNVSVGKMMKVDTRK